MVKEEFVREVAHNTGQRQVDVSKSVEAGLEIMKEVLRSGEPIHFRGFGTFRVMERAAKRVLIPGSKEAVYIPARAEPVFKPAKELREQVSGVYNICSL